MKDNRSIKTFLNVLKIFYYVILIMTVLFIALLFGCTINLDYLIKLRNIFINKYPAKSLFTVLISLAFLIIPGIIAILISSVSSCKEIDKTTEQVEKIDRKHDKCKSDITSCYSLLNEIDEYKLSNLAELNKVSSSIYRLKSKTKDNYLSLSKLNKQFYRIAKHSKLSKNDNVRLSWDEYLVSLDNLEN